MSNYSVKPLRITLRPSRQLAWLLGTVVPGCVAVALLLPLPRWVAWGLAVVLALCLLHAWARDVSLRLQSSFCALELDAHGCLRCRTRDGCWHEVQVLPTSTVTSWLAILNFRLEGRRFARHLVLLPDMLNGDDFRRLRVWLRWGVQGAEEEASASF